METTSQISNAHLNKLMKLAEEALTVAHTEVSKVTFAKSNNNLIRSLLMMRVIDLHTGLIGSAKSGSGIGSLIILRTILETFVVLKGCCSSDAFMAAYLAKHALSKKDRLKKIEKDFENSGFQISKEELDEIKNQTAELLQEEQFDVQTVYKSFRETNELPLYHTQYAHCSLFTHTDAHSLERYLDGGDSELRYETYAPLDTAIALSSSTVRLISAVEIYLKTFGIELNLPSNLMKELMKQHSTEE